MVRDTQCKFSELVAIKVDQRVFTARQIHYYSIIWITAVTPPDSATEDLTLRVGMPKA